MTNILPPWLPATETMNAWPEMLGIVHSFWTKNVCGAWEAEPKARGSLGRLVYIMSKGDHNKVIRGIWGQTTSPAESSLILPLMAASGLVTLCFPYLANQGLERSSWVNYDCPAASHTSHGLKNFR